MTPLVSIVIVNFKSLRYLPGLFDSIVASVCRPLEVLVVNNSPEETIDLSVLAVERISSRVLIPEGNTGFAGGNNHALRQAVGQYVMLLNPDTLLEPTSISTLVETLDSSPPAVAAALPKLLDMSDHRRIDRAWDGYTRSGWAQTIGYREIDEGQYDQRQEAFGFRGAACLFRASFFTEVGLFDEALFAFYEDVDLSLRGHLLGKRFLFEPAARVYHAGSASTGSTYNDTTVRLTARNRWRVYFKGMPGRLLARHLWRFLLMTVVMAGFHTVKTRHPLPFLQGTWQGLTGLPATLREREGLQAQKVILDSELDRELRRSEVLGSESRRRRHQQNRVEARHA